MTEELSIRNFARLARLVEEHTGIRLPEVKRTMLSGRLRRRVRALALPDADAYCRYLFEGGGIAGEFVHLIDAVTTNKTDFFREPAHFDFLRREAVPALLAGRSHGPPRPLKIWSAACSCGAEPYSIAMVLAELALLPGGAPFVVLGSDICTEMLDKARTAVYPADMMAPVPAELRRRYTMRARQPGCQDVRIVPELRARVRFRQLNLMEPSYPVDRDVDVIFCRNILIYFDKPTQQAVLLRLSGHLRPGGYLVLGHSESMSGMGLPLTQVISTVFRRGDEP